MIAREWATRAVSRLVRPPRGVAIVTDRAAVRGTL